ncbi:HU domain-containing protein [Hymenobacter latericus]|uniref:HU domain-containing protein n=1 Tax=Hymenobacter sp. YIM 151858-1 TaxID=2987688 RepID=UPI002227553C|nr:SPOR domain-containing protein [Hymenobacter sp. YIM 151858-1]UYZ60254.1 SPOR domain-containing protein [Hymenobacter sp. YIM 151858-1]
MQLTDHIQHLLRDHDCVIIPDFGGLIADYEPARLHPVRHTLAPPAKRVAFNQALTRNDGLLVDAISRHCGIGTPQARQQVREAVANMQQELDEQQRTELPGIGVFRRAPGRGIDFEYTGQQNLLPASFGLPELTSRPVRATDAVLARERSRQAPEPVLAPARRRGLRKLAASALLAVSLGLVLTANYQIALRLGNIPENWQISLFNNDAAPTRPVQAANLASAAWTEPVVPDGAPETQPEISKPEVVAAPAAKAKPAATLAPKGASVATATKAAVEGRKAVAGKPVLVKGVSNRWYVVKATFNSFAGAEKVQSNYASKGHVAKILMPRWGHRGVVNTKKYRVAVADFADKATAQRNLPELRKQFGNEIQVYPY